MVSKKTKQKLMKRHICSIARVVACVSFLILTIIGVSSLVRAMSLEAIANENGIPSSWQTASLGNPETITVPITYWDQREDDCNAENRQFEWTYCQLYGKGIVQGVVKNRLGADGLPIPSYTNSSDAWAAYHDVFTANVTGNDPVQSTDNFYRWFHEAYDTNGKQLSKRIEREVTFRRTGNNSYEYGSRGTFPLDDINFSQSDTATKSGHNFHFTAHMRIPMKISADGTERFWFSGDDDVWVFLNGQLVLDLGGLHSDTEGNFTIDKNGNVTAQVNDVNADQTCRQNTASPLKVGNSVYNSQLERCARSTVTTTTQTNFKPGQVINLDFFYAERSTSESNTRITITNMNWPISADSNISAEVAGKISSQDSNLVQFVSSITNRDPENALNIERIAAYIKETTESSKIQTGFLPLSNKTLYYSTNQDDATSWQPVEISAPDNTANGFKLKTPLQLSPSGQVGDTLYFRYFGESSSLTGDMSSTISYYTTIKGSSGVTYDTDLVHYEAPKAHQVTVKYLYEDDSEAAPTYQETIKVGENYEIESPSIDNFQPDIAKLSGVIQDTDIVYTVYYKRLPEPTPVENPKYTVTVKYVYEDGTPAAEAYITELEEGNEYSVISPAIEGYDTDRPKVEGIIAKENIEITVIYTKQNLAPVVPDDPEDPIPLPPSIPDSNIIGDDLIYLAPLGEVAFVPNTGIVDAAVAALFDETFASIILSQGFVMAMLLIFAGSFATYFSLRKFMSFEPATRTAKLRRKTPTMPAKLKKSTKNTKLAKSTRKPARSAKK